jgi:hypothetical protein
MNYVLNGLNLWTLDKFREHKSLGIFIFPLANLVHWLTGEISQLDDHVKTRGVSYCDLAIYMKKVS